MEKAKTSKYFYIIIIAVVAIDQLAKFFVTGNIKTYETFTLIPHVISITNIANSGIIFGMLFQNNNAIVIISLLLVCFLLAWIILINMGKVKASFFSNLTFIAFYLIIGGALSNIYDRIFRIAVVDYVNLNFMRFPIFNIADIAITAGAIMLVWEIIFAKRESN